MGDQVRLEVPATPDALALVRLEVGGVAALMGALVTDVEDLQLATDELCLTLFDVADPIGRLVVELGWDDESVLVRCSVLVATDLTQAEHGDDELPEGVVDRILDALVDEHGSAIEDGRYVRWLRKRPELADPRS